MHSPKSNSKPKVDKKLTNSEDFEQEYLLMVPAANLKKDIQGHYEDPTVRIYWKAYMQAFSKFECHVAKNRRQCIGPFFVAGYADTDEVQTMQFSKSPRFYDKVIDAEAEAAYRANVRGGKFTVFGQVSKTFTKKT